MKLPNCTFFNLVFFGLYCCTTFGFLPQSSVLHVRHQQMLQQGNHKSSAKFLSASELYMSKETDLARSWDFLDNIYLITTDKTGTSERFLKTRSELESVGLWDKVSVKYFPADDEDRVRGCYTSHIAVLKEIVSKTARSQKNNNLVLEDNLECTSGMGEGVLNGVSDFLAQRQEASVDRSSKRSSTGSMDDSGGDWDVFHLAYMMYVPGLNLKRMPGAANVVQMIAEPDVAVGTSAYLVSGKGAKSILERHRQAGGYTGEAIPNVMSALFPSTRFAAYPMVFHRAGKVGSLVNPQLDDFRKVMFNPLLYSFWEKLMVGTGLQNNQLFPGLVLSLVVVIASSTLNAVLGGGGGGGMSEGGSTLAPTTASVTQMLALLPLGVALWGASLFKPGNTGAGFAQSQQQQQQQQ